MPNPTPPRLQRLVRYALWPKLALILLMVLAVPLHRLIQPVWPRPIVEYVMVEDGKTHTRLIEAGHGSVESEHGLIVRRSRPINAAKLEMDDSSSRMGFPLGLRLVDGGVVVGPSQWRTVSRLFGPIWPAGTQILLVEPSGAVVEIPADRVRRILWPNRMNWSSRLSAGLLALSQSGNSLTKPAINSTDPPAAPGSADAPEGISTNPES